MDNFMLTSDSDTGSNNKSLFYYSLRYLFYFIVNIKSHRNKANECKQKKSLTIGG